MKTRIIASILLIALMLAGCVSSEKASKAAPTEELPPGIFMSNDPADFPLPTSGYTIYFVGETHGNSQTKLVFQAYLQSLYKEAGVHDIVLEEDQAYESDANAYVQGLTDELIPELCLRADILKIIRDFNASLAVDEKVAVHLVDVDSPLPAIYKHLAELHAQLGAAGESIALPASNEFLSWYTDSMYKLIDELQKAAENQPDILSGLATVKLSLDWFSLGNRLEIDMPRGARRNFGPLREDIITQNVQHVLSQLNGKPVLVFFGGAHGMKTQADPNPPRDGFKSWVQRLVEAGTKVYSLSISGLSGNGYWHGEAFPYEVPGQQQYQGIDGYRSADGASLVSFFKSHPDTRIIYADLRTENNWNIQLPSVYLDLPAGKVYDGLIIFKEFTPMENACPAKTK